MTKLKSLFAILRTRIKSNDLAMYREIVVACFEIHMDHVYLLYEHTI